MRTKQPSNFRTDLLVFAAEDEMALLAEMGCEADGRDDAGQKDRCVAIPHVPLKVSPNIIRPSKCDIK